MKIFLLPSYLPIAGVWAAWLKHGTLPAVTDMGIINAPDSIALTPRGKNLQCPGQALGGCHLVRPGPYFHRAEDDSAAPCAWRPGRRQELASPAAHGAGSNPGCNACLRVIRARSCFLLKLKEPSIYFHAVYWFNGVFCVGHFWVPRGGCTAASSVCSHRSSGRWKLMSCFGRLGARRGWREREVVQSYQKAFSNNNVYSKSTVS